MTVAKTYAASTGEFVADSGIGASFKSLEEGIPFNAARGIRFAISTSCGYASPYTDTA